MLEYSAAPHQKIVLRCQLSSTDTSLYPQTKIYDEDDGSLVDTINLTHKSSGLYVGDFTNDGQRKRYYTQTIIYTDSGYTTESPIDRPDSDSLVIGFNTTGGVFGSSKGGTVIAKKDLTEEEIKKIVKALMKELNPILDKKSEFNPEEDVVKTDVTLDVSGVISKLDDIKNNMGDVDIIKSQQQIGEAVEKIKQGVLAIKDEHKAEILKTKQEIIDNILPNTEKLDNLELNSVELNNQTSDLANKLSKFNVDDVNSIFYKTMDDINKQTEVLKNTSDNITELFSKVNLFASGALIGKEAEKKENKPVKKEKINILEDIERGTPAIDIYYRLKKLSNPEKDRALNIIHKKYPSLFKKLLLFIK